MYKSPVQSRLFKKVIARYTETCSNNYDIYIYLCLKPIHIKLCTCPLYRAFCSLEKTN